nr:uncharacterized protein LOC124216338 isoform X2 [Neodiprion pinetum]
MHVGVGNSQRFVNVREMYNKLGEKLCNALPAFHALTGCDYNPSFYRKGKNRPFTMLRNSDRYIAAFESISDLNTGDLSAVYTVIEEFVCLLPPCKAELQKQLKRTAYIAHLWRHAYLPQPTEFLPTDYGWQESEDKLVFEWFEGNQLPKSIDDIAINSEENQGIIDDIAINSEENQDKETNTEQDQGQSDEEDDPEINNSDIEDSDIILDETDDSIDQ